MRRFIAYLLSCLTIVLGIGVAFNPVVTSMNADLDYRDGKELTFKISNPEDTNEKLSDDALTYYADVMESRLVAYGISDYQISIADSKTDSTCDTIKVILAMDHDEQYNDIAKLLSVNPEIEVCNLKKADDEEAQAISVTDAEDGSYSWHDNKAYLKFDGAITNLIMPIPTKAKQQVEEMIKEAAKYEGGDDPDPKNDEGDDPDPEPKKSIILWMNRTTGDEYENKDKDPDVAKKVIYDAFNSTNFYADDDKDSFKITFTPANNSITAIRDAYNKANLMLNMLNASEVKFNCECVHQEIVPAAVESLLIYGEQVRIAMSGTFIATLVAIIVLVGLLGFFYRLSACAMVATTGANVFLTFVMFTAFGVPFNIASLVGMIAITLASLVTPIAYHSYLQEECYKGRNLKKANYEASKRTTLLTVDVSVVAMLIGIITYFVGGTTVGSAGVILIIFSVLNILINTFILKGLMWLLTNETKLQDKKYYRLLNIKGEHIPDLSKEEKQTYFGPFAGKDLSKKKHVTGAIVAALTLASVIGLAVFGAKGQMFNSSSYYTKTPEVAFTLVDADDDKQLYKFDAIKEKFNQIKNGDQPLKYGDLDYYSYSYVAEAATAEKEAVIKYANTYVVKIIDTNIYDSNFSYGDEEKQTLDAIFENVADDIFTNNAQIRFGMNEVYNIPNITWAVIASIYLAILVTSFYLWIRRYRLSRVLALLGVSSASTIVSVGMIALTRINATPVMAIAGLLTMLTTLFIGLIMMHKDKMMIKEERLRDIATRNAILKKSFNMALVPSIIVIALATILTIDFLALGNTSFIAIFVGALIGGVASTLALITLFVPTSNFLDEKFARIELPEFKVRKKQQVKVKSNEPEEATFIGIND